MARWLAGNRSFHLACAIASIACALASSARGQTRGARPRMLYVSDAGEIVGDAEAEARLLARARAWRMSELALYGLGALLDPSRPGADRLAAFSRRARASGIELVAPIASIDRMRAVARFEEARPDARFHGWVTELEYWRECGMFDSGRRPCFDRLVALLGEMERARAARADQPWIGVYVGYPTREEAREIGRRADRVLLSYHGRDPSHARTRRVGLYSMQDRRAYFAHARAALVPIVYARGEVPMARWLTSHTLEDAERGLDEAGPFAGFAFFDYGALERIARE